MTQATGMNDDRDKDEVPGPSLAMPPIYVIRSAACYLDFANTWTW